MTGITQRPGGFSYQRMTNVSPATWQVFSPAGRVAALTYSARDAERVADALGYQHPPAAEGVQAGEVYLREQPCGCRMCVCEDEKQCQGCGAKHCGNRTDHPAYVKQQPAAAGEEVRAWETEDGRVISARQKETALRDGGASASSVAIYSIPLYTAPPSATVGVELAALRVQEWLHREHDILPPVQEIEQAMRTPCSCPLTEQALAPPPAAVDGAVGTVTRVGSFEVQEHRIELDPEFDERLNNMPEGTVVRLYATPVRDLTQQQLAAASAALATQQQEKSCN